MFSTPETSVHVLDKNREIILLNEKSAGETLERKGRGCGRGGSEAAEQRLTVSIDAVQTTPTRQDGTFISLCRRQLSGAEIGC